MVEKITTLDLAELFGCTQGELAKICESEGFPCEFSYREIRGIEKRNLISEIESKVESNDLAVAGESRFFDWEEGWRENLKDFINSGFDLGKLIPKYYKKMVPIRFNRKYVMPVEEDLVLNVTSLFRAWICGKYLSDVRTIFEFGCGPAHHLVALSKMFPNKKLVGLDWAKVSQEIIDRVSKHHNIDIVGKRFDFFSPDYSLKIDKGSGVLTFGALEQVGNRHEPFLKFLLANKPEICVNVECLLELYDLNFEEDVLAYKYHKRRGYLEGYLTRLRELESVGDIEILKIHHQKFGNLYDDPHSYVIWRVRN